MPVEWTLSQLADGRGAAYGQWCPGLPLANPHSLAELAAGGAWGLCVIITDA